MIRGNKVAVMPTRAKEDYEISASIHNRFDIEVMHPDGSVEKAVAFNNILDQGWTRIINYYGWFASISYGSGTGVLALNRTDLFTRLGTKSAASLLVDTSHFYTDSYVSFRKQIQIPAGEQTGQTLREVGISYDTSAGHLCTHALLQDMNGNTVSIAISALDVINIYATVFVGWTLADGLFLIPPVGASMYGNLVAALAGCGNLSGQPAYYPYQLWTFIGEPAVESCGNGNQFDNTASYNIGAIGTKSASSYSTDIPTKKIFCKWSLAGGASFRIAANELNPAVGNGWRGIRFADLAGHPADLALRFPNTTKPYCTITGESVGAGDGSKKDFSFKFPFVLNDGSLAVKINGVAVDPSYYTVNYNVPPTTDLTPYMKHVKFTRQLVGSVNGNADRWDVYGTNEYEIFENPFYATVGITSLSRASTHFQLEVSDDMASWLTIVADGVASGVYNVAAINQKKRYWRVTYVGSGNSYTIYNITSTDLLTTQLHFVTGHEPAAGAAITADYHTATICKDASHVVDFELTLTLSQG